MVSTVIFSKFSRDLHCPVYLLSVGNAEPKLYLTRHVYEFDFCSAIFFGLKTLFDDVFRVFPMF